MARYRWLIHYDLADGDGVREHEVYGTRREMAEAVFSLVRLVRVVHLVVTQKEFLDYE